MFEYGIFNRFVQGVKLVFVAAQSHKLQLLVFVAKSRIVRGMGSEMGLCCISNAQRAIVVPYLCVDKYSSLLRLHWKYLDFGPSLAKIRWGV